jgi:hypothetical protein
VGVSGAGEAPGVAGTVGVVEAAAAVRHFGHSSGAVAPAR